ncbi:MAG: ClpXP protease specificity-enhancing factor SspB [Alphaproteobacteria bacterium]
MEIQDTINYDKLIEKSLKNVVKDSLKMVQEQGPIGEHHFFITFKTNTGGANLPPHLLSQYPEEMTIILQHQFDNLEVRDDYFSVDLSFGGIPQRLTIDFDAVIYFADPSAKFGLSFESLETENKMKTPKPIAEVVSIDAFRKAKK